MKRVVAVYLWFFGLNEWKCGSRALHPPSSWVKPVCGALWGVNSGRSHFKELITGMLSFLKTLPASIKKGRVCCKVATHSCPPCQCVTYHQKVCRVRLFWISLPEHIAPFFGLGEMTPFTVSIHFFAAWKIKYLISVCAKKKSIFHRLCFFLSAVYLFQRHLSPLCLLYILFLLRILPQCPGSTLLWCRLGFEEP